MSKLEGNTILYKRSRFSTRLPIDRRYTAGHYWLAEEEHGVWRVGFTKFATRMLGDLVEYAFSVYAGAAVLRPELFKDTPATPFSLTRQFNRAAAAGRLHGLRLEGVWMHVGTPEAVGAAEEAFLASVA